MQKNLFLFLSLLFVSISSYAQQLHRCGTVEYINSLDQKHPGFKASADQVWAETIYKNQIAKETLTDSVLRIPVVVHVVYNTPAQNISDSVIHNQIAILNRDYNRQNADTANLRSIFGNVGKGANVEFYLATTDTLGNPTTGIVRKSTSKTAFVLDFLVSGMDGVEDVKKATYGSAAWDPTNYMNIWVCNLAIDDFGTVKEGSLLGVAVPPTNPLPSNWPMDSSALGIIDGIVIYWKVFGDNNPNLLPSDTLLYSEANKGRTTVHEVGHYLGLRHIWADKGDPLTGAPDCTTDSDSNGVPDDDGMSDTPFCAGNSSTDGCNPTKNSCTFETPDLPDMWENYMDYSKESCLNTFTAQQVAHMRSILLNQRINLISNNSVGVNEVAAKPSFTIHPNPSHGLFNISLSDTKDIKSIKIYDQKGVLVYSLQPKTTEKSVVIDLQSFAKGIYLVQVSNQDNFECKKLVVE